MLIEAAEQLVMGVAVSLEIDRAVVPFGQIVESNLLVKGLGEENGHEEGVNGRTDGDVGLVVAVAITPHLGGT